MKHEKLKDGKAPNDLAKDRKIQPTNKAMVTSIIVASVVAALVVIALLLIVQIV